MYIVEYNNNYKCCKIYVFIGKMAEKHKIGHLITEILGVFLGIYLLVLGLYADLHILIRISLIIAGVVGMLVDGYFITTWIK